MPKHQLLRPQPKQMPKPQHLLRLRLPKPLQRRLLVKQLPRARLLQKAKPLLREQQRQQRERLKLLSQRRLKLLMQD
jgi:hypothetical protein